MEKSKLRKDYVERDVSWMYFNHRILQEAQKQDVPLLERLSFLGIYSNNLDEFFCVRVASLKRMMEAAHKRLREEKKHIEKVIKTINQLNEQYSKEYDAEVQAVFEALETHGIHVLDETQLDDAQKEHVREFFFDKLNGMINPIWISHIDKFAQLDDNKIYLLVRRMPSGGKKPDYALIKLPVKELGRWFLLPKTETGDNIMYLDDVVRYCLPLVFSGFKESSYDAWSFKFTKDAEMDIADGIDEGVLQKIKESVDSRKLGEPVRLLYDKSMPKEVLKLIMNRMNVSRLNTSLAGGRYQSHKDLMKFPDCGHTELKYETWKPLLKPEFKSEDSLIRQIRKKDIFIHMPYHSFDGYIRLLREAALRPDVRSIKTTLYRLASDSKVVKALICAANNGKKVTAVVELLARFDEESNIEWSKRMKDAGINVVFGVEGLKVHAKLLHIESKSGNIACIGTGNFHENNAKTYTDYLMMTARKEIVSEVAKVFDFIDKPFALPTSRKLLVSPITMKPKILRLLDNEIRNAKAGKEAWVKIKINHITEPDMVHKLYEASRAGVKIDILIRGNCSLMPGVPGMSDNIRCVGLIDRYLEHSRILIFANGGKPKYYIGSADWMPRNLLNRIEVYGLVEDRIMQDDLMRTIDYGLRDSANGRLIDGKGGDRFQDGEPFRSQQELHQIYNQ